jgi:4-carboxymuconolactone decarboxylase
VKRLAAAIASFSLFAMRAAHAEDAKMLGSNLTGADVRMVAPALEKYRQDRLFGDVWKRPGLSPRDRSIVTLATLIVRNQTIEMPFYLNLAFDNGVKPQEVSEIITHLAFYSGWGSAMSAAAVTRGVFTERKIGADQLPPASPALLPLNEAAEAQREKRVGEQFGAVFPGVVQYTTDVLFRDLWLRPGLAPRDRSLVTVSALIALNRPDQLRSHLALARQNGVTEVELVEAITHLAFYSGWPNAVSAVAVAREVFKQR